MIYLLSFMIVIGLPVFLHELGHFLAARSVGIKVEKFYVGFNIFGMGIKKKYGETEYGIGLFPLGGYVKVAGILDESMDINYDKKDYEFRSKGTMQKIWFLSAGVIMNFILSSVVFSVFTFINGYAEIIDEPIINEVVEFISDDQENSPAYLAGLQSGDRIVEINNINVNSWAELSSIIHNNPEKEIKINWLRNGFQYSERLVTKKIQSFKDNKVIDIGIIGVSPNYNKIDVGFFESIFMGCQQTYEWIDLMLSSLYALVSGSIALDQLSGPLGIANVAGETAKEGGILALIMLMGIISVNLGIINILPIPGLDGGHVFIALIEGAMGRELPLKVKYGIQTFGFMLLMLLFVFVFYNDIKNLM
tara:strand:- start:495 stop:1583 length:1089 start_codon:yes stop_codon:yes gene_type:complete